MLTTGKFLWRANALENQLDTLAARGQIWSMEMEKLGYDPKELSALFAEHHLLWIGMGSGKIALCPEPDLDLLLADKPEPPPELPQASEAPEPT